MRKATGEMSLCSKLKYKKERGECSVVELEQYKGNYELHMKNLLPK